MSIVLFLCEISEGMENGSGSAGKDYKGIGPFLLMSLGPLYLHTTTHLFINY